MIKYRFYIECSICSKTVGTNHESKKYCSYECNKIAGRLKYQQKIGDKVREWKCDKTCKLCKSLFIPNVPNQKYCSKDCSKRAYDVYNLYESISKLDKIDETTPNLLRYRIIILDRDNFTCQYCGRNPRDDHGVILHIDHKIPKHHGGNDNLSNLITSCSECNLGKGDLLLNIWNKKHEKK